MQIESIASTVASTAVTSIAARGGTTSNSDGESAVVERTSAGYEAYVAAPPGPIVTGSSIEDVEFRLHSTVQFQA
jgi:hypothetical protein